MTRKPTTPRTYRQGIPVVVKREVLIEAGYRCAVPTCRSILALDLHHLDQVSTEGGNKAENLLALCPNCHALHHRGVIHIEALRVWKSLLVSLNEGISKNAKDDLLFLSQQPMTWFSTDGVLRFTSLIAAGLVTVGTQVPQRPGDIVRTFCSVYLSPKGQAVVAAWKTGDKEALAAAQALPCLV